VLYKYTFTFTLHTTTTTTNNNNNNNNKLSQEITSLQYSINFSSEDQRFFKVEGHANLIKYVLRKRLKHSALMVGTRMKPGREFQTVGPATEKAR